MILSAWALPLLPLHTASSPTAFYFHTTIARLKSFCCSIAISKLWHLDLSLAMTITRHVKLRCLSSIAWFYALAARLSVTQVNYTRPKNRLMLMLESYLSIISHFSRNRQERKGIQSVCRPWHNVRRGRCDQFITFVNTDRLLEVAAAMVLCNELMKSISRFCTLGIVSSHLSIISNLMKVSYWRYHTWYFPQQVALNSAASSWVFKITSETWVTDTSWGYFLLIAIRPSVVHTLCTGTTQVILPRSDYMLI